MESFFSRLRFQVPAFNFPWVHCDDGFLGDRNGLGLGVSGVCDPKVGQVQELYNQFAPDGCCGQM